MHLRRVQSRQTEESQMAKTKADLNPKQHSFVLAILKGKTQEAATHEAGYKDPSYGRQLIAKTHIRVAVQQGKLETALRAEIDQDWLVEREKEILAYALTPIRALDRYGKPTGPEMRQLGAANTAVFNIAKLTGLWVDRGAVAPPSLAAELFEAIGARPMTLIEQDPDDDAED